MRMGIVLVLVIALSGILLAETVWLVEPMKKQLGNGDVVDIGPIGPGQTVFIEIEPIIKEGENKGLTWDLLNVTKLPSGWKGEKSALYGRPTLQAKITASAEAKDGSYPVTLEAIGGEKLGGPVSIKANVQVKKDVVNVDVQPKSRKVGAGQPAVFYITIQNTGITSDVFEVTATGKLAWDLNKKALIPAGGIKEVRYEVGSEEGGNIAVDLNVKSSSSPLISKTERVNVDVETNLISDYKATNNGLMIFPIMEQPVYSLMGLISNLFN
ncbi:Uncharacterised protein [Candidatus Gugararchaeum adminiculabundum]|nr:Uncharacterised protein [Candidatus Gugararchaeum adminiculabundum]